LGFEPRQRDPESLVLPLHHEATSEKNKDRCASLQVGAVAVEDEFTRRRSCLVRAGFRCFAEHLRLQDRFRFLSRVPERILPSCLPSRRCGSDHGETAEASEPRLRARAKRRWKSNRVPSRCASCIPDRCTVSRGSECRCRAKIEPTQRADPRQFLWFAPDSIVFPGLHAERIHTARDREEKQRNRNWRKFDNQ